MQHILRAEHTCPKNSTEVREILLHPRIAAGSGFFQAIRPTGACEPTCRGKAITMAQNAILRQCLTNGSYGSETALVRLEVVLRRRDYELRDFKIQEWAPLAWRPFVWLKVRTRTVSRKT